MNIYIIFDPKESKAIKEILQIIETNTGKKKKLFTDEQIKQLIVRAAILTKDAKNLISND